jgi:beta-mannosidase
VVAAINSAIGDIAAIELCSIDCEALAPDEFLFFAWRDAAGRLLGENDYFPRPYKAYELVRPEVTASWSEREGRPVLTLETDRPAFFVSASVDVPGYFSDNAMTLLPGRPVELVFTARHGASPAAAELARSLRLRELSETYHTPFHTSSARAALT